MPRRMVKVRNKTTGQVALVSESAFGYFAADFERLDKSAEPAPPAPASAVEPALPKPPVRRAAAKNDEE